MECLRRLEDELMPLPGHLAPKHKQPHHQHTTSDRHNATATAAVANITAAGTTGNVSYAGKGAAGRRHVRRRLFAPAPPPSHAAPGRDPEPFR